ncbi:ComEC/Rec2 family competence protein [Sphingomonas morindae]|uniref:ComEC/Rec2 family competence protein n=1 Tax=Sphingomonas morindae TaxID=1541170 RepID=A0ABY4X4G3_9SPHN|nr:ComEC/Rec2 family competence protein [Sphingomonas morindae]USI71770.1 ComEC/Rec2 family competence protein [Sphingomonas morindae]
MRQTFARRAGALEHWLEAERDQLPLWLPVMLLAGIAAWYALPGRAAWAAWCAAMAGLALGALGLGGASRAARALGLAALGLCAGCALIWHKAERMATPRLDRPRVVRLVAEVRGVEALPARGGTRLTLAPRGDALPKRVRVMLADAPPAPGSAIAPPLTLAPGMVLALRARLVPPPPALAPGGYDFRATAWFAGLGASGRVLDRPVRLAGVPSRGLEARLGAARRALGARILARVPGAAGAVAVALATGDTGAIAPDDAEAFRRSGLAHLLSVSGLHLSAMVGATIFAARRLLALLPWLALRIAVPLLASALGAVAGSLYTVLTGSAVPTLRALIAALLVLAGAALGREAITLRLVASGALLVLIAWPDQAAGPSFQLSFAAVLALVALYEAAPVRRHLAPRPEPAVRRWARAGAGLLLAGLVVEAALMPIAIYHFHRAGFYGALANLVAIPLTSAVVMPAEALALLLEPLGLAAPAWWVVAQALALLLWLARRVALLPGAVALVPDMSRTAFALIVAGGLWLALWRTRARVAGLVPLIAGLGLIAATPPVDLVVTADGRHVALRRADGSLALLRARTGDYVRGALAELGGQESAAALAWEALPEGRCSADLCLAERAAAGRRWRIAATRSAYPLRRAALAPVCAWADIMVSERRLPGWCRPRWLKADAALLARTGGLAIRLAPPRIDTVAAWAAGKPWADSPVR